MSESLDGLVDDLKKALHHAQKNNQPEQARHLARLLTEALKPQPQQPATNAPVRSRSGSINLPGWPLRGLNGSPQSLR